MFGFLIKKSFWDLWDNMGRVLVSNLLFSLIILALYGIKVLKQYSLVSAGVLLVAIVMVFFLYLGSIAAYIKEINDFKTPEVKTLFQGLKRTWTYSLYGGLFFSVVIILTLLGMQFYLSLGGFLGLIGLIFLFWIFVTVGLSSLYYFPIMIRLPSTFPQMLKKSFLFFIDNPILTIGVFLGLIINGAISLVTVFLMPGPAGALLWIDNNLRLLIYKYDYLEENPDAGRKIPWRVLYREDNEKIGPRTFRNTIFPWK